jgi:Ca-activated chloride channel family protein
VVGEIKERQQARVIYEQAKQSGQRAALTEQEWPNIFTNSVANIGPGETVLVQIEYQEPVRQSGDVFSLRVPMVVGPRYNPAPLVQSVDLRPGEGGWGVTTTDPVPDRERISPPVLDPAQHGPVNPTQITVRLQAGFPLGEVKSHHHAVKVEQSSDEVRVIKLAEGPVPADRDFELTWKPAAEKAPSVGLFRERVGNADYLLAYVTPPTAEQAEQKPLPREAIFVIDNSGSMCGTSMVQAKASLIYALGRLQPGDRFNVIRFDHTMDVLFPTAVAADAENVGRAKAFVDRLQASGGTEMVPAMRAALNDTNAGEQSHVRQVVFLTDGAIGNEQQLFDTISALRGRSRVFMVGIGSAPNSFLMTRAAELGRGAFTHIGSVEQVEERMRGLFAKLESPVVTGIMAKFSDAVADPRPLSRRAAGSGGEHRQACGLGDDHRPDRRPTVDGHATGRERGQRQRPVEGLGAAEDRRCRDRPHHAAGDAGGRGQDHPDARARASAGDAAHQPGRGRQDPCPTCARDAQAHRAAAQPAVRLGLRKGVRRAAEAHLDA